MCLRFRAATCTPGGDFIAAGGKVSAYVARAYLLPLPILSVISSETDLKVSWPSPNTADFTLELRASVSTDKTGPRMPLALLMTASTSP